MAQLVEINPGLVAGSYPPLAEVDPERSEGDGACLPAGRVDRPQREQESSILLSKTWS